MRYADLSDIQAAFVAELKAKLPDGVDVGSPWADTADDNEEKASSSNPAVSFSDVSSPLWIAKEHGFIQGKRYFEKNAGHSTTYVLASFNADGAVFTSHNIWGDSIVKKVGFEDLKSKWSEFKGEIAAIIPTAGYLANDADHVAKELARVKVYTELMAMARDLEPDHANDLRFAMFPSEVRTGASFKKGELVLLPTTVLQKISLSVIAKAAVTVDVRPYTFSIEAPAKPSTTDVSRWGKNVMISGYWWVGTTSDQSMANMVISKKTQASLTIPALVNSRALKIDEVLMVYKAPDKKQLAKADPPLKKARVSA